MIAFTITNSTTEQVYVGSTRNEIDAHWETLIIAAESGVESPLYDDIRAHGPASFDIAEWGIAEDLQELRELMQDAMATFNAISLQGLRTKPKTSSAYRISEQERKAEKARVAEAESGQPAAEAEPVTTVPQADKKPLIEDAINPEETDMVALAKQRDAELEHRIIRERQQAREMAHVIANIESRKKGKSRTAASKPKAAASSPVTTKPNTEKLATGKVTSAKQERKIREQIELEREQRQAEKIARQKAEAQEMAQVMARIDARAQSMRKTKPKAKPKSAIRSSSRTLSLKKPEAIKDKRLELDQDLHSKAELQMVLAKKQAAQAKSAITGSQTITPQSAKPEPALRMARPQRKTVSKDERIADTISRYRGSSEKVAVNPAQSGSGNDLANVLQARLANRRGSATS